MHQQRYMPGLILQQRLSSGYLNFRCSVIRIKLWVQSASVNGAPLFVSTGLTVCTASAPRFISGVLRHIELIIAITGHTEKSKHAVMLLCEITGRGVGHC